MSSDLQRSRASKMRKQTSGTGRPRFFFFLGKGAWLLFMMFGLLSLLLLDLEIYFTGILGFPKQFTRRPVPRTLEVAPQLAGRKARSAGLHLLQPRA